MLTRIVLTRPNQKQYSFFMSLFQESGLKAPNVSNLSSISQFWFTETGWELYGLDIKGALDRNGISHRVVQLKEDDPKVDILYEDAYQVVLGYGDQKDLFFDRLRH